MAATGLSDEHFATLIHPGACVSSRARLGPGTVVNFGASVGGEVEIGRHATLGPGCVIGHDAVIEDFAMVAPGAIVSGLVRLSRGCYVGAGAAVKQKVMVGDGALVGLGAVVVKDVPGGATEVGNPARPIRSATPDVGAVESLPIAANVRGAFVPRNQQHMSAVICVTTSRSGSGSGLRGRPVPVPHAPRDVDRRGGGGRPPSRPVVPPASGPRGRRARASSGRSKNVSFRRRAGRGARRGRPQRGRQVHPAEGAQPDHAGRPRARFDSAGESAACSKSGPGSTRS